MNAVTDMGGVGKAPALYGLHGLSIRSDLDLGRPSFVTTTPSFELRLGPTGPVPDQPPPGERLVDFSLGPRRVYSAASGEANVLRVHGLCDFVVDRDLKVVECRPEADADLEHLALVARGAMLAFYLGLAGSSVLHASAVEVGSTSVAFVGGTGMGKSTLAAWACTRGARFVCDDLLRLGAGTPPAWVGCSPELRLRPGAAAAVDGGRRPWGKGRVSVDGRLTVIPPGPDGDHGSIGAVVVPRPSREIAEVEIRRLAPVDAALVLSAFPRLEGWCAPGAREAQLDGVSRLAGSVPMVLAAIPWGPPFADSVIDTLLEAVCGDHLLSVTEQPSGLAVP